MTQNTQMTRKDLIAALLIEHPKIHLDGKLTCRCGYAYKLGESIAGHRAEVIEAGLTMLECGVSPDDVVDAVRGALKIVNGREVTRA